MIGEKGARAGLEGSFRASIYRRVPEPLPTYLDRLGSLSVPRMDIAGLLLLIEIGPSPSTSPLQLGKIFPLRQPGQPAIMKEEDRTVTIFSGGAK